MLHLYGIPNCDGVRKARAWLAAAEIEYTFHDFKREGVSSECIGHWQEALGWDAVLNRRGTTWRGLPEAERIGIGDAPSAMQLMQRHVSLIKRPILEWSGGVMVGFSPSTYAAALGDRKL